MIKFGPSGNSSSFYASGNTKTLQAPAWVSKMGLTCFEYPFGKGVLMGEDTAIKIGEEAKKNNIEMSVHAPYFINFANLSDDMVEKSYNYVLDSLKMVKLMGGNRCVVHTGSCAKLDRTLALELCAKRLKILAEKVKENGFSDCLICLETMGKVNQIGTYKEIIDLCTIDNVFIPTFDFGHINALTHGSLKTESDFEEIFTYCFKKLGIEKTRKVHIHFSKIEYAKMGEVRHLTFEDEIYGPNFEPLARVLKKFNIEPFVVCESNGTMAEDALTMKKIYESVK